MCARDFPVARALSVGVSGVGSITASRSRVGQGGRSPRI